jgi:hypothetical protein
MKLNTLHTKNSPFNQIFTWSRMHTTAAHGAAEATAENRSIGINRLYDAVGAFSTSLVWVFPALVDIAGDLVGS